MFSVSYQKFQRLPQLAWLADIDKRENTVTILHGEKVERFNDFFVAGVWDREFEKAEFDAADAFYGTGGKITENAVIFSTPSHALERLQYYDTDDRFVVSNSFPFLASYCELKLDPGEDQYEAYFCSVLDGLEKYRQNIPMKDGKQIHQVIASNISVSESGTIKLERRSKMPPFASFEDYYSKLMQSFAAVRDNAVSPKRKNAPFGIVSTISSGYDSTCCAVIAKKLGCDCVVSLSGGGYDADDGSKVAERLGYSRIIKRDKDAFRSKVGIIDAEYISSGEIGTALQFSVFEDIFEGNLVFMGLRGSYWEKHLSMTEEFEMCNYSFYETDVSVTENALKNGYIIIPLPTYGASACISIKNISNSSEMKPWTLGVKYDKPIPRRIVESAGIPRNSFGQIKYGGGFYLGYETAGRMKRKMSKDGYEDFLRFRKSYRNSRPISRFLHGVKYYNCLFPTYLSYACGRIGLHPGIKQKAPRIANPFAPNELFHWSVDVMKKRYSDALK